MQPFFRRNEGSPDRRSLTTPRLGMTTSWEDKFKPSHSRSLTVLAASGPMTYAAAMRLQFLVNDLIFQEITLCPHPAAVRKSADAAPVNTRLPPSANVSPPPLRTPTVLALLLNCTSYPSPLLASPC